MSMQHVVCFLLGAVVGYFLAGTSLLRGLLGR